MEGDLAPLRSSSRSPEHGATLIVDDSHGLGVSARPAAARPSTSACSAIDLISPAPLARRSAARRAASSPAARRSAQCSSSARARSSSPTASRPRSPAAPAARSPSRGSSPARATLRGKRADARRPASSRPEPARRRERDRADHRRRDPTAIEMSRQLLDRGVYVTGFGYPVVPEGTARVRVQVSAALTGAQIDTGSRVARSPPRPGSPASRIRGPPTRSPRRGGRAGFSGA